MEEQCLEKPVDASIIVPDGTPKLTDEEKYNLRYQYEKK
jgi:hypothetical protein